MRKHESRFGPMVAFLILTISHVVCLAQDGEISYGTDVSEERARMPRFPEMAHIRGGEFLMGSPVTNRGSYAYRQAEHPQRQCRVDEFWITRRLVTAEEYCIFLNEVGNDGYLCENTGWTDCRTIRKIGEDYSPLYPKKKAPPGSADALGSYVPQLAAERCPAYPVTWKGAVRYCEWLSDKLGHDFRLPAEVEWEFAARGTELRDWPWGNEPPLCEYGPNSACTLKELKKWSTNPNPACRLADSSDARTPFYDLRGIRWMYTGGFDEDRPWPKAPVGSFPLNATPDGVYDMLAYIEGQWCMDVYSDTAYLNPGLPKQGVEEGGHVLHVIRGRYAVHVDHDIFVRTTPFLIRLLSGDAGGGDYELTPGRSWSRSCGKVGEFGAIFRIASSKAVRTE